MSFGVNITDPAFGGATPTGDWTSAFQNAINAIATNSTPTGGVVFVPRGTYTCAGQINIVTARPDALSSITIQGEGMYSTIIDFNLVGTGLNVQNSTSVKLRDFCIRQSIHNNILLQPGEGHIELTNVWSRDAEQNGIYIQRNFMLTMRDVFCSTNKVNGFYFADYHTSISAMGCYAVSNNEDGWVINDMTYSSFISCGADKNNKMGWRISNITAVSLISCGAESNKQAGFYIDGEKGSGSYWSGVINLNMESCFADNNNIAGGFCNLLYIKTSNNNEASVVLKNSYDLHPQTAEIYSIVINGTGGKLINDNNKLEREVMAVNGGSVTLVQYGNELGPINVNAANTLIIQLCDIFKNTVTFGGMLTIHASNKNLSDPNANTATYLLLVSKILSGSTMTVISKLGLTNGTPAGTSWPSFDFSLSPDGKLRATPLQATNGQFYFQLTASGNLSF